MRTSVLSIVNALGGKSRSPGISFYGPWLHEMGFGPDALVQMVPEPGGLAFRLCDDNIRKYSELCAQTREQGGKLIQMKPANPKWRQAPALAVHGQIFERAGLTFGDNVSVLYEYGIIKIRKLPETLKIIHMTSVKDKHMEGPMPKLQLTGDWLAEFGFIDDSLLTAAFAEGAAVFELWDGKMDEFHALVQYARKNRLKLLQVKMKSYRRNGAERQYPYICITGSCLERTGFAKGDALTCDCRMGLIKLQKPDSCDLGF